MNKEVEAARQLSEALDGASVEPTDETAALLDLARRLERLNATMPSVPVSLEQRVEYIVGAIRRRWVVRSGAAVRRAFLARPLLTGAALALVVLVILAVVGPGAMARFGGSFTLGQVQVRILSPTVEFAQASVATTHHTVASLADAERIVGRTLAAPANLPSGYALYRVTVAYYKTGSGWWSPALFVDQAYRPTRGTQEAELTLRQYFISLGRGHDLAGLDFTEPEVRHVSPVKVRGWPGVLLTIVGTGTPTGANVRPLYVLIWQAEDAVFELSASNLTTDEMLTIARSVR